MVVMLNHLVYSWCSPDVHSQFATKLLSLWPSVCIAAENIYLERVVYIMQPLLMELSVVAGSRRSHPLVTH